MFQYIAQLSYHYAMSEQPFSQQLEKWLNQKGPKTLKALSSVISEKSFAMVILVLMFVPALPLPTGGITHIFEIITVVVAFEMVIGRRTIWLPSSWQNRKLGAAVEGKAIPFMIRRIRWFERFARPRFTKLMDNHYFLMLVGLVIIVFTIGAFVAPPFSGLDTLPSLGVVIIALSLIFSDFILFIVGCATGIVGIGLVISLGAVALTAFKHFI